MDKEFAIIDDINEQWGVYPKNTLLKSNLLGGETKYWFAWEHGELRLLLMTIVGRRKGLREVIYLIDNSRSVYIDRLRLADVTTNGDGKMLPLTEMRNKVRACGQDPHEVAELYMRHKLEDLLMRTAWYLKYTLHSSGPQCVSIEAVQGGAPGLGKRH